MVDYGKWKAIDGVSSEDEEPSPTAAAELGQRVLSSWICEANPQISPQEARRLVSFVEAAHPHLGQPDNVPRAAEVIEWVESNGAVDTDPILEAAWQARLRDSKEPSEAARLVRMKAALHTALNTAVAVNECGDARTMFDRLWEVFGLAHFTPPLCSSPAHSCGMMRRRIPMACSQKSTRTAALLMTLSRHAL